MIVQSRLLDTPLDHGCLTCIHDLEAMPPMLEQHEQCKACGAWWIQVREYDGWMSWAPSDEHGCSDTTRIQIEDRPWYKRWLRNKMFRYELRCTKTDK